MPVQDFGLNEWVLTSGAVAGSVTAMGIFSRKAFRTMREFFQLQAAAGRIISAELTTNHGSSMLDKINKIAPNHVTAEKHWTDLDDRVGKIDARVLNVERRLHEIEEQAQVFAAGGGGR